MKIQSVDYNITKKRKPREEASMVRPNRENAVRVQMCKNTKQKSTMREDTMVALKSDRRGPVSRGKA